jgi:adenylate cyclase
MEMPLSDSSGQLESALPWSSCPAPFSEASGYLANSKSLPVQAGHITPRLAADGVLRHQPALICFDGKPYPALAIKALMAISGERNLALQRGAWFESDWMLGGSGLLPTRIPVDAAGDVRLPWRLTKQNLISISAADALEGRYPKDLLRNAIVLVGSSSFGLHDAIATPLHPIASGMQAHAELLLGLLDERVPYTPAGTNIYALALATIGLSLLLLLGRSSLPAYWIPVAGIALGLAAWTSFGFLLWNWNLWLGWAEPAAFIVITGLVWGGIEHARSRWDRDRLYEHLSSYLPASVAASLAFQPPSGAIKASSQSAVVLFADIRNFSAYCEARPAPESAAVLHAFFSSATAIIEQHGGVIEAFEGDAVIAFWGNVSAADSAQLDRPLAAALALQKASLDFLPNPAPAELEPLVLGIGLELGPTIIGSFGLAKRRAHLILGPTVSATACLVKMTGELSHPILIGGAFAQHFKGPALQPLGIFLLDGLKTPHSIFAYPHPQADGFVSVPSTL